MPAARAGHCGKPGLPVCGRRRGGREAVCVLHRLVGGAGEGAEPAARRSGLGLKRVLLSRAVAAGPRAVCFAWRPVGCCWARGFGGQLSFLMTLVL